MPGPPAARVYHTLEIWQTSFDQAARVVANFGDDKTLGSRTARRVTRQHGQIHRVPVHGGLSGATRRPAAILQELDRQCRALLGAEDPRRTRPRAIHQVLYREYLGSDLTEPAYGPVEFELTSVQMTGTTLSGIVVPKNLQNKRVPRIYQE
jgi:hypothetical protein